MLACVFPSCIRVSHEIRRVFTHKLLLNLFIPVESSLRSNRSIPPIFYSILSLSLWRPKREEKEKGVCVCVCARICLSLFLSLSLSLGTVHLITYPVPAYTVGARVFHSVERFTWVCIVPCRISSAKKITVYGARDSESETRRFRNLSDARGWLIEEEGIFPWKILSENISIGEYAPRMCNFFLSFFLLKFWREFFS